MPTIMDKMRSNANALYVGHFKEQLNNEKRILDILLKEYQKKLHDIDILEIQQKTTLDTVKKELKELFKRIKKQEKIYIQIQKNIHSLSRTGEGKKKKRKTKIKKKSMTINYVGGDGARTRRATAAEGAQKICVHTLFTALSQLAGSKTKVDYLLGAIKRAGEAASDRGELDNHPMLISQWKALFSANKFRIAHDDALKANLLDPNEDGSIAQLSQEAMSAVMQTGKSLENKIGTRDSAKNIIKELNEVFRNNVDYAFINIEDNGRSGLEGGLDRNIWQPEADLLFAAESADVYNFANIEESRILQEKPIQVKLKFGNQAPQQGPGATRVLLARLWNFFFDEANQDWATPAYFDEKLDELCKGWDMFGHRKIIRIINRLTAVNEERFTALIPYLPAIMFKDTPPGDRDYDIVSSLPSTSHARGSVSREDQRESDVGVIRNVKKHNTRRRKRCKMGTRRNRKTGKCIRK